MRVPVAARCGLELDPFEDMFFVVKQYKTLNSRNFFMNSQPSSKILARIVSKGNFHHFYHVRNAEILDVIPASKILHKIVMIEDKNTDFTTFWVSEVESLFEIQ